MTRGRFRSFWVRCGSVPWHKPSAGSVWLGCSVWPLCRPSQVRSPAPGSDTLHLSVKVRRTTWKLPDAYKHKQNSKHIQRSYTSKDLQLFPLEVQTGDPLCETLPQEMHNRASAEDCGHRQWCHFLIFRWGRCCQSPIVHVSLEGVDGEVVCVCVWMRPACLWPRGYSRASFDSELWVTGCLYRPPRKRVNNK